MPPFKCWPKLRLIAILYLLKREIIFDSGSDKCDTFEPDNQSPENKFIQKKFEDIEYKIEGFEYKLDKLQQNIVRVDTSSYR